MYEYLLHIDIFIFLPCLHKRVVFIFGDGRGSMLLYSDPHPDLSFNFDRSGSWIRIIKQFDKNSFGIFFCKYSITVSSIRTLFKHTIIRILRKNIFNNRFSVQHIYLLSIYGGTVYSIFYIYV